MAVWVQWTQEGHRDPHPGWHTPSADNRDGGAEKRGRARGLGHGEVGVSLNERL